MEFKIFYTNNLPHQSYQDFLLSNQFTLFYQNPLLHELLEKHLEAEAIYLVWTREEEIVASFPFMLKKSKQFGSILNSLPYYGSNGSFIFQNNLIKKERDEIRHMFVEWYDVFAIEQNIVASTIVTSPFQQEDSQFFEKNLKFTHTDERIGQITILPQDSADIEQDLFSLIENPRPRNVRKAIKSGIRVEKKHNIDALKFLFQVHKENIEGIGGKAKEWQFFELVPQIFGEDDFGVYIAYLDNKPIAAMLLFFYNKTVEYFTPATLHEFRNLQPSSLLIFEAMKEACNSDFKYWNWGGTWHIQKGVYDFKRKWGAKDYYYKYFINVNKEELLTHPNKNELVEAFPYFYLFPY